MVSFDAGFLSLALHPDAKPPLDPATKQLTTRVPERLETLLEKLDATRERIIIPAPALAEFLVLAGPQGPEYISQIASLSNFFIAPFDQMAAVELAAMELLARSTGSKRFPALPEAPWQKVKFDRQIVAISRFHKAHTLYSDDQGVHRSAQSVGIQPISCWELELPPSKTPLLESSGDPIQLK